jgi:hypothetical protein
MTEGNRTEFYVTGYTSDGEPFACRKNYHFVCGHLWVTVNCMPLHEEMFAHKVWHVVLKEFLIPGLHQLFRTNSSYTSQLDE